MGFGLGVLGVGLVFGGCGDGIIVGASAGGEGDGFGLIIWVFI